MPEYPEVCPTSTRMRVKTGTERKQNTTDQHPLGKRKSALDFSVQDASAALPQNCQTTIWMVEFRTMSVNVTSVTRFGSEIR